MATRAAGRNGVRAKSRRAQEGVGSLDRDDEGRLPDKPNANNMTRPKHP